MIHGRRTHMDTFSHRNADAISKATSGHTTLRPISSQSNSIVVAGRRNLFLLWLYPFFNLTMSHSINGGGGSRGMLSSVDFYRRVPKDLTEVSHKSLRWILHWEATRIGARTPPTRAPFVDALLPPIVPSTVAIPMLVWLISQICFSLLLPQPLVGFLPCEISNMISPRRSFNSILSRQRHWERSCRCAQ